MRLPHIALLSLPVAAALACGQAAPGSAPGTPMSAAGAAPIGTSTTASVPAGSTTPAPPQASAVTQQAYCTAYVQSACDTRMPCCTFLRTECEVAFQGYCNALWAEATQAGLVLALGAEKCFPTPPGIVKECVQQPFDSPVFDSVPAVCSQPFVGTVAAGMACTTREACYAPEGQVGQCKDKICTNVPTRRAEGSPCVVEASPRDICAKGLYCDVVANRCTKQLALNTACNIGAECLSGWCLGTCSLPPADVLCVLPQAN